MSDKLTTVIDTVTEIQQDATTVLGIIKNADPAVAGEAQMAEGALLLLATLVTKALAAWQAAAGIEITPETIAALMPNPVPLTPPDEVE